MLLVAAGNTQKAVAEELGISRRSVERHLRAARDKKRAVSTLALCLAVQDGGHPTLPADLAGEHASEVRSDSPEAA